MNRTRACLVLLAVISPAACSDSEADKTPTTAYGGVAGLKPPPEGKGVQLRMASSLGPGVETERCMFYQAPDTGFYMNRAEVRYSPGSHHILLYSTPYKEIPKMDNFGNAVDTSGIFECGKSGPTAHWQVDGVVAGAQKPNAPTIVEGLPPDTAFVVPPKTVLLMNTHYLNASGNTLETDARINIETMPKEQVKREAGVIFFYNPFIYLQPRSQATARQICPVRKDIYLVNAQSHMHKRATDYVANLLDPLGEKVTEVFQTKDWDDVLLRKFTPHMQIKAGMLLDYKCTYTNKTDKTVIQGLTTDDEMCMLVGLYYPRDRRTELCGVTDTFAGGFVGGVWVGDGAKAGKDTAECLQSAGGLGGSLVNAPERGAIFRCVVESCPKISRPMSDAARCLVTNGLGECDARCGDGKDPAECRSCMSQKCEAAFTALSAAKCE